MSALTSRLAKLEAAAAPTEIRQFTFSGGEPDADLRAYARTFGVELTDRDVVVHTTGGGTELSLQHCSDMSVVLACVAKYGKRLVPDIGAAA